MAPIGALVLAGGQGHRFGGDKRFAQLPTGQTLLGATLAKIIPAFEETVLVLRPGDEALAATLAQQFKTLAITIADNASFGMGHSLAHGASMIGRWQGAAVCLGDMPFHKVDTFWRLIKAFREAAHPYPIIKPSHEGRAGHPVLFHHHYFEAMQALSGDQGARALLKAHAAAVQSLDVADAGILLDVDQPSDLSQSDDLPNPT